MMGTMIHIEISSTENTRTVLIMMTMLVTMIKRLPAEDALLASPLAVAASARRLAGSA